MEKMGCGMSIHPRVQKSRVVAITQSNKIVSRPVCDIKVIRACHCDLPVIADFIFAFTALNDIIPCRAALQR
jgi:hypothetical protein